jgi:hypothetical protein
MMLLNPSILPSFNGDCQAGISYRRNISTAMLGMQRKRSTPLDVLDSEPRTAPRHRALPKMA